MTDPVMLPEGELEGYSVQVFHYASGIPPHTFLRIKAPGLNGESFYYGFAPVNSPSAMGEGKIYDESGYSYDKATALQSLTGQQYTKLAKYINNSIESPPYYNAIRGDQCTTWTIKALSAAFNVGADSENYFSDNDESFLLDVAQTVSENPYTNFVSPEIDSL